MWCGRSNEAILVLSDEGVVYRSRDQGQTWRKLQKTMMERGREILDEGQDVSKLKIAKPL